MRIQKVSNSMSARPGPGQVTVSLSTECDNLRNEIRQLREELEDSLSKNEKLEVELEETKATLASTLEKIKGFKATKSIKCIDCDDVIEEPLCQTCLNAEQHDSREDYEDIVILEGDND